MKRLICWLAGIGVVTFTLDALAMNRWMASSCYAYDDPRLGCHNLEVFALLLLGVLVAWVLLYGSAVLGAINSARRGRPGWLFSYVLAIPVIFLVLPALWAMTLPPGSDAVWLL